MSSIVEELCPSGIGKQFPADSLKVNYIEYHIILITALTISAACLNYIDTANDHHLVRNTYES